VSQTVLLLLAGLLGGALVAGGVLAGVAVAGRPARMTERRLDRALAISEAERSRMLSLLLARTPAELAILQTTTPAPPPPPDRSLGGPPEPPAPWEAAATEYTPDPNELTGWDDVDDAAIAGLRH
jgi:hypothetical protein